MYKNLSEAEDLRTELGAILDQDTVKWIHINTLILRNKADAEDAFQEAVSRMLERGPASLSREHIRQYLGRTVNNTAFGLYKDRKRERVRHRQIEEYMSLPSKTPSPDFTLDEQANFKKKEQQLRLLRQGLQSLPVKHYDALRLTILEARGATVREAESVSGTPESTLRYRSRQGLRMLRKYVEREMKREQEKSGKF